MAEEHKSDDEFGPLEYIIAGIILFLIASSFFAGIRSQFGSGEETKNSFLRELGSLGRWADDAITQKTLFVTRPLFKVGDVFKNGTATILYASPGGAALKGILEGKAGRIIDGPLLFEGVTWWKVQYDDGSEGWVSESSLLNESGEEDSSPFEGPVSTLYTTFRFVSTTISLLLLVGIAYATIRLYQVKKSELEKLEEKHVTLLGEPIQEWHGHHGGHDEVQLPHGLPVKEVPIGRSKWSIVERHINSPSESDWRLAILEADVLLDELARVKGWHGINLGERLKSVDRSDFRTIDSAWEAHKMRNTIAHEGINYALSEREAKRIIKLFEEVFNEFGYI